MKLSDLDDIEEGFVLDLIVESNNDHTEQGGTRQATQEDFDRW